MLLSKSIDFLLENGRDVLQYRLQKTFSTTLFCQVKADRRNGFSCPGRQAPHKAQGSP